MNTQARIINRITHNIIRPMPEIQAFLDMQKRIPGWSTWVTQLFFRSVLAEESVRRVLVCGVYHGLDLALIQHLADTYHPERNIELTGVDIFSAEPCKDWPPDKLDMTWEQAFDCPPPSLKAAQENAPKARIHKTDSTAYLMGHAKEFDFIFLDTSHDEQTVRQEVRAAMRNESCILAGDDYYGPANWGVDKAVGKLLPSHAVVFDRIWIYAP